MLTRSPRPLLPVLQQQSCSTRRPFVGCVSLSKKSEQIPPRPTLPDKDVKWEYLKGSGPGGQKIVCQPLSAPMRHQGITPQIEQNQFSCPDYTSADWHRGQVTRDQVSIPELHHSSASPRREGRSPREGRRFTCREEGSEGAKEESKCRQEKAEKVQEA